MEVDTFASINVPELNRNYVKETLRSIELLKHVERKTSARTCQPLPFEAQFSNRFPRRAPSETDSRTAPPLSGLSRSSILQFQTEQLRLRRTRLELEVHRHLFKYAKYWCRVLVDQMHLMLPRELRDIIYGFVAGDARVDINESQLKKTPTILPKGQNQHTPSIQCNRFRDALECRGYSHLLSDDFVSIDVMRELAETWYSLATHRLHSPQLVEKFLRCDVYGFKLNPCSLVRKLEIVHYLRNDTPESFNQLCTGLIPLIDLNAGAKVQITLWLRDRLYMSTLEGCTSIPAEKLVVLFPGIRRLVERGLHITMQFGSSLSFKVKVEELTEELWANKFDDFKKAVQSRQATAADRHLKAMLARRSRGFMGRSRS